VRDPELILFDEPLSHLDADQKIHLRGEIKRLQKLSAVTSILVTHDQTEATALADRIAVMNNGVLQQVATPRELYERPANIFVANFIGEPPMNILPLRAQDGVLVIAATGWPLKLDDHRTRLALAAGGTSGLIAGIRPEHVMLVPAGEHQFRAIVTYCEPRGDVDLVIVRPVEGNPIEIVAEVPGPSHHRQQDLVGVALSPDHIYLFAAADGRNLERPS
jgi:ABC-type sugar transport system ATPase subunit